MKTHWILAVLFCVLLGSVEGVGQTLTFLFRNAQVIPGTPAKFQYEVWIQSSDGTTRMGSIQVYNNYNTSAFGTNIVSNTKVAVTANTVDFPPAKGYDPTLAVNDNADGTFSYSWTHYNILQGTVVPNAGDGIRAFTVSIDIADASTTSNMSFAALMIGQQYKDDEAAKWGIAISDFMDVALPVTLTSLTAAIAPSGAGVRLEWKTASEVNNYGYTVQRKGEGEQDFTDLSGAFIAGKGTTVEPQVYSYVDGSIAKPGSYGYRLKQQDLDGTVHYTQTVNVQVTVTDVAEAAPKVFQLMQNYPNPFNPSTQVKFSVETTGKATVKVYNMLGAEMATLFEGTAEAGRYYVATFDAASLATGIYFYRLTTEKKNDVKRMLLVK
jgi:hypothetical protein